MVDKEGKVLAAEAGSPDGTVAVVRKIVEGSAAKDAPPVEAKAEDAEAATTAAEVADTAAKVDA